MPQNKTAAALTCRGNGRRIETKTSDHSSPTLPSDQEARRDTLALLTRAYRSARAEAAHVNEMATNIAGIGRALKRGIYTPDFALERAEDIGALDIIDDDGGRS